jgi:hypothetical protein
MLLVSQAAYKGDVTTSAYCGIADNKIGAYNHVIISVGERNSLCTVPPIFPASWVVSTHNIIILISSRL